MAVAFGFSFGDFVAALELISTVVNALGQSSESSSEYRELLHQLYSLETALQQIKGLHLDDVQHVNLVALRQAASQCQRTVDDFWNKIQKYQPHLRSGGSNSMAKDGWMKIKWAICQRDDVAKFKADIVGHTESLQILLATVQIASVKTANDNHERRHQSLLAKLQNGYVECCQRLSSVSYSVSYGLTQGKKLLQITTKVLRTNLQTFQVVVAIQTMMAGMPSQIERQQPVYLIDALGKYSPFHLEFVRSAEALTAVIKINFREVGEEAVQKIERGKFVIQDSATNRDIDLAGNWEICFSPGQRVEMSIIFTECGYHSHSMCPKCTNQCTCALKSSVECSACGTRFRRIENIESKNEKLESHVTDIVQITKSTSHTNIPDHDSQQSLEDEMKTRPLRRSPRLLDHLSRVRIHIPPLEKNHEIPKSNEKGGQIDIEGVNDPSHSSRSSSTYRKRPKKSEDIPRHSRSEPSRGNGRETYRLFWTCCECRDSPHRSGCLPACGCGHTRCTDCPEVKI